MKSKQYRAEVKTRAVELRIESQKDYPSMWAAIQAIAPEQHAAQGLHTRNLTVVSVSKNKGLLVSYCWLYWTTWLKMASI